MNNKYYSTQKKLIYYNLEEQYRSLKINTLNFLGLCVDNKGFIYDEESLERMIYKNKYVNINIESDMYKNIMPFSMMNTTIFLTLFGIFSNLIDEEENKYIVSINEEYTKPDENGISKSRLIVRSDNGFLYYTDWYYISGLKFIEMMARITDTESNYNFSNLDSYKFVMDFNERSKKIAEANSRSKKRKEKLIYDFE